MAIIQLAVLKKELGDLSRVKRIVKVNGFVNATDSFFEPHKVINGFSDLLIEVFGESGKRLERSLRRLPIATK